MSLARDDRALAWGWLVIVVMTLSLFALAYIVIEPVVTDLFDLSAEWTATEDVADGRSMGQSLLTWSPLVVLGGVALALLARAIHESALVG